MSTVPEHVQRLSLIRKLWVREFGRQPTDQELMLDLAFKEEATRLCAVHLSELEAAHVSGVGGGHGETLPHQTPMEETSSGKTVGEDR